MKEKSLQDMKRNANILLIAGVTIPIVAGIIITLIMAKQRFNLMNLFPVFLGVALSGLFYILISTVYRREFRQKYKKVYVKTELQKVFQDLQYEPENGISSEHIVNVGMIKMGNQYRSEDYLSGTYKDVKFAQSDVVIQDREKWRDAKGNIREKYTTIFNGRYMVFEFNKDFSTMFFVIAKSFQSFDKQTLLFGRDLKKIEMEDEEFNKLFTIYGTDELEVYYVLTPQLMEKLKRLIQESKSQISFGFYNHHLEIAVNHVDDAFEYSLFGKWNEQKMKDKIQKDINIITQVVDELSLENTLFSKES